MEKIRKEVFMMYLELLFIFPAKILSFDPKISVRTGFSNLENCPGLTICYFLKLLRILMVSKCKIIRSFLESKHVILCYHF